MTYCKSKLQIWKDILKLKPINAESQKHTKEAAYTFSHSKFDGTSLWLSEDRVYGFIIPMQSTLLLVYIHTIFEICEIKFNSEWTGIQRG